MVRECTERYGKVKLVLQKDRLYIECAHPEESGASSPVFALRDTCGGRGIEGGREGGCRDRGMADLKGKSGGGWWPRMQRGK